MCSSSLLSLLFVLCVLFPFVLCEEAAASSNAATNAVPSHLYASALTLQVEPREEQCFFEDLEANKNFRLEFEVVRGGLLDIKLKINDPSSNVIIDKMAFFNRQDDAANEAEGRVQFTAAANGPYKICFDNTMSRWTAKIVSFFVLNDAVKTGHEEVAKLEHLGPVVDSVIKIADELDNIEQIQHHTRVREQQHRDATESTNSRVQWLSVLESILLVGLTMLQLHYIRNWFAETSSRGRV